MELNFCFEIRAAETMDPKRPHLVLTPEFFPEGFPDLPAERRATYEGTVDIVLLHRKSAKKRTLAFLLDFGNPEHINVGLTENGMDCVEGIFAVGHVPKFVEQATEIPVLFTSSIPWVADRLIPKVRHGKTVKGILRIPLPPVFFHIVSRYFVKAN